MGVHAASVVRCSSGQISSNVDALHATCWPCLSAHCGTEGLVGNLCMYSAINATRDARSVHTVARSVILIGLRDARTMRLPVAIES